MRPAIATVLTAAPWERELVTAARMGGLVRVIGRCRSAFDVDQHLDRVEAIVVGAETGWLSAALLHRWRAAGTAVVGVVPPGDRPALDLMQAGGAEAVLGQDDPPLRLLSAIVSVAPARVTSPTAAVLATVVGARGAPGRSEVALALAWTASAHRRTLLIEVDTDAPGLGLRLGLDPGPGLERSDPALGAAPRYRRHGPIQLLTLPLDAGPLSRSLTSRVVEMARQDFGAVVVDGGPLAPDSLGTGPGRPVLVVNPSPSGLIRAGRMVATWSGPTPLVVANRVPEGPAGREAVRLVRAATGLEPVAVVPVVNVPGCGEPPDVGMTTALDGVARALFGWRQRSAAR